MQFFVDRPIVRWIAALAAVVTLVYGVIQYAWHLEDLQATALQEQWLEMDKDWNNEIISRLRNIEERCLSE